MYPKALDLRQNEVTALIEVQELYLERARDEQCYQTKGQWDTVQRNTVDRWHLSLYWKRSKILVR